MEIRVVRKGCLWFWCITSPDREIAITSCSEERGKDYGLWDTQVEAAADLISWFQDRLVVEF